MKDMEEIRKKLVTQMFEHINSLPLDKREAYFKRGKEDFPHPEMPELPKLKEDE